MGDGDNKITIYRKPSHTDQYLDFTSHHPLVGLHKGSVVHTLTNRAKLYVTTPDDQQDELEHVQNALRRVGPQCPFVHTTQRAWR